MALYTALLLSQAIENTACCHFSLCQIMIKTIKTVRCRNVLDCLYTVKHFKTNYQLGCTSEDASETMRHYIDS